MTVFGLLIVASLLGGGITWLSLKYFINYLIRKEIVDRPNERTLHLGTVPRGGGLIIIAVLFIALLCAALFSQRSITFAALSTLVLLWGGVSWWDDHKDIAPHYRFVFQALFAAITVALFGRVTNIQITEDIWFTIPIALGALLTFVGIVWMANLYNFMDGMDGMAASQSIIASITLSFWFWQVGDMALSSVCAVLAASCYAFLCWNWRPAKVFMGDVGSVTLGAFFATLLVIGVTRYDFPVISFLLLFSVFISDASLTISRRIIRGDTFWLPHRTHYYQRLANIGISHTKIVLGAVMIMLLTSLIASLSMSYRDMIPYLVLFTLIMVVSTLLWVVHLEAKSESVNDE